MRRRKELPEGHINEALSYFCPLLSEGDEVVEIFQKEVVEELKKQWKKLWQERINDQSKAEGVANQDYSTLFVDRGTVIIATRDCKPLNFREILEQYKIFKVNKITPLSPTIGEWSNFIMTTNVSQKRHSCRQLRTNEGKRKNDQQLEKGDRGWAHI